MVVNKTKIRYILVQENDEDALPDDLIDSFIEDAQFLQSGGDLATAYFTAYLMAKNWQNLGFVESHDGVKYKEPDPNKIKEIYEKVIKKENSSTNNYGFNKVSTNKNFVVDDNVFQRDTSW